MTTLDFDETKQGRGALTITGRSFRSRLMLGTRKYRSPEVMADCHRESGAEMITVAVRRVNISDRQQDSILSYLADNSYFLLPNKPSAPPVWRGRLGYDGFRFDLASVFSRNADREIRAIGGASAAPEAGQEFLLLALAVQRDPHVARR